MPFLKEFDQSLRLMRNRGAVVDANPATKVLAIATGRCESNTDVNAVIAELRILRKKGWITESKQRRIRGNVVYIITDSAMLKGPKQ